MLDVEEGKVLFFIVSVGEVGVTASGITRRTGVGSTALLLCTSRKERHTHQSRKQKRNYSFCFHRCISCKNNFLIAQSSSERMALDIRASIASDGALPFITTSYTAFIIGISPYLREISAAASRA